MADTYSSAAALLALTTPVDPVVCLRPQLIAARARRMLAAFPGDMLYAVKCNDAPEVLRALWDGGVRAVRHRVDRRGARGQGAAARRRAAISCTRSRARMRSPRRTIEHGVRRFVFDHPDELAKIVAATGGAGDLELFVRLAVPGEGAMLALTGKFGVGVDEAGGAGACGAWLRPLGRASRSMSARNASIPWPLPGRSRWWPRSCAAPGRSTILTSAAASRRATWATSRVRGVRGGDPRGGGAAWADLPAAVRAGPGAGRRRRLGAGPRRAAPRPRPLPQRRRLRQPRRAEMDRAAVPDAAGARRHGRATRGCWASTCSGPPATVSTACPGRTGCRPTPRRATGSRSA